MATKAKNDGTTRLTHPNGAVVGVASEKADRLIAQGFAAVKQATKAGETK